MRFADPQSCPDCGGAIAAGPACPHCHLDLTSLEVRQLWQVLLQADQLLARASTKRVPVIPAAPAEVPPYVAAPPNQPTFPLPPPPPPVAASVTPPAASPSPARSWSVGTVLLVLGAFGLVVAGIIFVTRSWQDIGLAGRTLILLGVTAVIGALAVWVTRRALRASAEAVWAVFLALLTLDVAAARHEDLGGLGALSVAGGGVAGGVALLGLSLGIAVWARPHLSAVLIAPCVAGGLAITVAGVGAGGLADDWDFAWRAVIALVVAGLLALVTRPAGLRPMTLIARVVVAGFYVAAYVAAFVSLADDPRLLTDGRGVPLLLMAVLSIAAAWLVPVVRVAAVALALFALSSLVVVPVADDASTEATWSVLAALAVVLAAAGARGTDDWMRGVRLGALPAVAGIGVVHVVLVAEALGTVGRILDDPWQVDASARLDVGSIGDRAAWVVPVVLAALVVTGWLVSHWPELPAARHAPAVAATALAVGTAGSVVALRWPVWAAALVLLGLAAVLTALRVKAAVRTPAPVVTALVLAASLLAAASQGVSVATWVAGGLLLGGLALSADNRVTAHVDASIATGLLLSGVAALADLLDLDGAVIAIVVVVAALAVMASAELLWSGRPTAPAFAITAAVGLVAGLVAPAGPAELSVRWTIAGVGLIALGLAVQARRWLVWPGIAALVVAYLAVIVDSGFSFVEAYTLPLGAAGLAAGLVVASRKPGLSTWATLGPGLALALLPSVPQALADPTGLRALLLGLGAVAVLAIGVHRSWQAPFVGGVTIATLLVLFNIGPYANAAPRVVLIAAVSAVLLGVGITWEDRVRDGRRLVRYVRSMH